MIRYEYQIVRYIHDKASGEFVNAGIVLYEEKSGFLSARVLTKFSRIANFFGEVNGYFILHTLKHLQREITSYKNDLNFFLAADNRNSNNKIGLQEITSRLLLSSDSALYLTEVKSGLAMSAESALEDLYERMVDKYTAEKNKVIQTDAYAWAKIYKEHFDNHGITPRLRDHTVRTHNDQITFDKAWKNGVWNCYQTLAFDLRREESVKWKVYKWSGIIKELQSADEKMHLFILTTTPKSGRHLDAFIKDTLSVKNDELTVTIVTEDQAEEFATGVARAMDHSLIS